MYGMGISNLDWMIQRGPDHYLTLNIGGNDAGEGLEDMEGAGAIWESHWLARLIATVPVDKIVILNDMVQRVKSGELEIKVN